MVNKTIGSCKGYLSILAIVGIALMVSSGLIGTVSAEQVIFEDDFDSYAAGSFPSSGGWNLKYNGYGTSYQIVDSSQSVSQPNSLKLEGRSSWAASADHAFTEFPDQIIFEVDVKPTKPDGGTSGWANAYVTLIDPDVGWGKGYGMVVFGASRLIYPSDTPYNLNQWYHVKVKVDMTNREYDFWIDDEFIGTYGVPNDGYYKGIRLDADNSGHTRAWFDNVKVYDATAIPATIDIDPDTLNLKSNGEWITAYMELPDDCDVNNIDISTVVLTTPSGDTVQVDPIAPTTVEDYDVDGIYDLMVKFDMATVVACMGETDAIDDGTGIDCEIELTIAGELTDGMQFEGTDTIRVIKKGK